MTLARRLALGSLAVAALAGCAPENPYRGDRPNPPTGRHSLGAETPAAPAETVPLAPTSGELPGRAPPELLDEPTQFPQAGQSPQATLALAARLYGNWTSQTATGQLKRMAALSVGQAHAELRQAAAQASVDSQQAGARSRARVEVISVDGQGTRRQGVVVTREHIVAPDLPPEGWRYQVTVAALERRADRWLISRWAPQP